MEVHRKRPMVNASPSRRVMVSLLGGKEGNRSITVCHPAARGWRNVGQDSAPDRRFHDVIRPQNDSLIDEVRSGVLTYDDRAISCIAWPAAGARPMAAAAERLASLLRSHM